MFSDLLQSVSEQYAKNLPFVVYRKPKETIVKYIHQEDSEVYHAKDFTETGFVFSPFDSREPSILMMSDTLRSEDYIKQNELTVVEENTVLNHALQKEFHINLVEKGIQAINRGEFEKVVLSRRVEVECVVSPVKLFTKLLSIYGSAFCYLWHHPKIGTWLGATPEILLKTENQRFTTMSLAGTKKYEDGKTPAWGNKELEEQQLVTDYISNALQDSVLNLNVEKRESFRAGSLWHLRTKLTGQIKNGNLADIIKSLHPTPAVCGLPLSTAKNFIQTHENYNREFYTGFLGELNFKLVKDRTLTSRNQENKAYRSINNTTTLFVNLRCMQLKDSIAQIYVGGGVTRESNAENEWLETVAKSKTMLKVLNTN